MKRLKSENGYSLLLTLMLVLLFSILGASLMAMTFNGVAKNDTREEIVQSSDLANKGIEQITAQITNQLNQKIGETGISATDYIKELNIIIKDFKCDIGTPIKGNASKNSGSSYSTCIYKVEDDIESAISKDLNTEYLRKILTFKSKGKSGDKTETLYSTYNIGSTQYPEVLNYAVGAYKSNNFSSWENGEGNLVLNGGVSIEGDVKVDGDLITSDYGIWQLNKKYRSVESVLPQVSGVRTDYGKIYVGGKLYRAKNMSRFYDESKSTYENYTNAKGEHVELTSLEDLFLNTTPAKETEPVTIPKKLTTTVDIDPIDFETKYKNIYLVPKKENRLILNADRNISNTKMPNQNAFLSVKSSSSRVCKDGELIWIIPGIWGYHEQICEDVISYYDDDDEYKNFKFYNTNEFKKLGIPGSVNLSNATSLDTESTYIGGTLTIGELTSNRTCPNQEKGQPKKELTIKGVFYISGDLTICNRIIRSDAIFYVEGEVIIQESQIEGIKIPGSSLKEQRISSLMLFSKDSIYLSNNSVDDPNPSHFKGYLYSEKVLEIYGVGSNISINGGISARKIILNAIRGNSQGYNYEPRSEQNTLAKSKSRLQIIYDEDIIKNFSELDIQTEPWINNISPPVELKRTYEAP